jgi:hypothetical protein
MEQEQNEILEKTCDQSWKKRDLPAQEVAGESGPKRWPA